MADQHKQIMDFPINLEHLDIQSTLKYISIYKRYIYL